MVYNQRLHATICRGFVDGEARTERRKHTQEPFEAIPSENGRGFPSSTHARSLRLCEPRELYASERRGTRDLRTGTRSPPYISPVRGPSSTYSFGEYRDSGAWRYSRLFRKNELGFRSPYPASVANNVSR